MGKVAAMRAILGADLLAGATGIITTGITAVPGDAGIVEGRGESIVAGLKGNILHCRLRLV
jgi:hypothetical protein